MTDTVFDVAVIGGGVVGTAVARLLSHESYRVVLLEGGRDVGAGASKATSGVLRRGDTEMAARGYDLLREYAPRTGVAIEPIGALTVAWTLDDMEALAAVAAAPGNEIVERAALYDAEPQLAPGALGALVTRDECAIDPFAVVLAFATEAVENGVQLRRSAPVDGLTYDGDSWTCTTPRGDVRARFVVDAAGVGNPRREQTGTARHTEFVVLDRAARPHVRHVVRDRTCATVVSPSVFGTVIVGPWFDDRNGTATTRRGLDALLTHARRVVPALAAYDVTAAYAADHCEPRTGEEAAVVGDAATGVVSIGPLGVDAVGASMAVAERARASLRDCGLDDAPRSQLASVHVADLGDRATRPYLDGDRIAADAQYGRVVCHCEGVTRGDLRDARRSAVPPLDLDGLRRRTGVLMGPCQGSWCLAACIDDLASAGHGRSSVPAAVRRAPRVASNYDVVVVGGGPAGLAAATALRRLGVGRVALLERDPELGGVARYVQHAGFGLRDLRRIMRGPAYAHALTSAAERAGVELLTETSVTGWHGPATEHAIECTGPGGRHMVQTRAVVLATGARERPRAARLVAGTRPGGVLTTASLQRLVAARHWVGNRAVIVGAEHASYAAVLTCMRAGVRVVAMVAHGARHESFAALDFVARRRYRIPLYTRTRVEGIVGNRRVEGIELSGHHEPLACDTVVFTGEWVPDSELARRGDVATDAITRMPLVDTELRTSVPGVFAAGNLLHAAQGADVCALEGRHAAVGVAAWLAGESIEPTLPLEVEAPLAAVTPNRIAFSPRGAPRGAFLVHARVFAPRARITVRQDGDVLWSSRPVQLVPSRAVPIDDTWLARVDPAGAPVTIAVAR